MTRQFPIDDYYSLLQAFDKLGQHLNGSDWTGTEAWSRPVQEIGGLAKRHSEIDAELEAYQLELIPLQNQFHKMMPGSQRDKIDQKISVIQTAVRKLEIAKGNIPDYSDSMIRDAELFARREIAEQRLIQALVDGKIEARYGHQFMIDWKAWSQDKGFRYFLALSMAVVSSARSTARRAPIFIGKAKMDAWLYLEVEDKRQTFLSPEELCAAYIRDKAQTCKWSLKEETLIEAQNKISGLSKRAFDRAWSSAAPENWKQSGRREGS